MKRYLFILNILLILILIIPATCTAEETNILTMEELSIKVMPEFAYHPNDTKKEHPPLLIGYQGTMLNHSEQPQKGQIEIPLPMKEKNFRIGYVADYSSDLSKVYEIEYIIDQEKGTISWTTSEEIQPNDVYKFVIEFYSDNLAVNQGEKSLSYQFKSFADIGLFNVSFIQPLGAENFELDPAPEKKTVHEDEEGVFSYNFQGIKIGDEKQFSLKYERSEKKPSVELIETQDPTEKPQQAKKLSKFSISIAAISGAGLISIFAIILFRKRKNARP